MNLPELSSEKFRVLFEYSSDAHLIITDDKIVDCNDATIKLLKCETKEEVFSIHPRELSPEFQPDGESSIEKSKKMDAITREKGHHRFEWIHQKKDGETFPVEVTLNSVTIDNRPALIAVWHDLTERKRAEIAFRELSKQLTIKNHELQNANERMKRDLDAAAHIQKSLLPSSFPDMDRVRAAWSFRPCTELAGDILNIFMIDEENLGLYVLDVSGHGVASSLLSVTVSHFLSPFAESSLIRVGNKGELSCPSKVAYQLNEQFSRNENNQFFTMIYGVLNIKTLELTWVSAGHPAPFLSSKVKDSEFLSVPGYPIGIMPELEYSPSHIKLDVSDRVYFFSDGVFETRNEKGEEIGLERVRELLDSSCRNCIDESVDILLREIEKWAGVKGPDDDISILAIEVT